MGQKQWQSNQFNARVAGDTAWTNASLQAAPAGGLGIYITDINVNAGATSRTWSLLDGSGGTAVWKATPAANTSIHVSLAVPIRLTAATALCLTTSGDSVGASAHVNGFIARR